MIAKQKKERALEFVWRASSSLAPNASEIFCHVFESYYCMPGPFQFEWNAPYPNDTTRVPLAHRAQPPAPRIDLLPPRSLH